MEPVTEDAKVGENHGRRRRSRSTKDPKPEVAESKKQKVESDNTKAKPIHKENTQNGTRKRKSKAKGETGLKVKRTVGRQLTSKKQPKAKRKIVSDSKPSLAANSVAKPDVPREILVCRTSMASSPSSSASSAPSSPLSDIQNTPQPYMLPESMRRKSNKLVFADDEGDQSSSSEEEIRSPSPPPRTPESLYGAASNSKRNAIGHSPLQEDCCSVDLAIPKATLTSEHDRVMNDAAHFISEVLQKKDDKKPAASSADQSSPPKAVPSIDEEALADFFRALNDVLENNEDVTEEELAQEIDRTCGKSFSELQVQEFLDHLCQNNRIMRSDGQLFII